MQETVLKSVRKINRKKLIHAKKSDIQESKFENADGPINTQHLLISTLLSPAVKMFIAECEAELTKLCGERYLHGKDNHRWGAQKESSSNPGSLLRSQMAQHRESTRRSFTQGHRTVLGIT